MLSKVRLESFLNYDKKQNIKEIIIEKLDEAQKMLGAPKTCTAPVSASELFQ